MGFCATKMLVHWYKRGYWPAFVPDDSISEYFEKMVVDVYIISNMSWLELNILFGEWNNQIALRQLWELMVHQSCRDARWFTINGKMEMTCTHTIHIHQAISVAFSILPHSWQPQCPFQHWRHLEDWFLTF